MIYKSYMEMREVKGQRLLTATEKAWRVKKGRKILFFISDTMR